MEISNTSYVLVEGKLPPWEAVSDPLDQNTGLKKPDV